MAVLPLLILLSLVFVATAKQVPFATSNPPPIFSVSADQWEELNKTVSGRLLPGVPFSQPCFSLYEGNEVSPREPECQFVRKNYLSETARTAWPAAQINTQWETCQARGESCLLDSSDPFDPAAASPPNVCRLGSVSSYYIDVRKPSDVQAAFTFSRTTHVPLVIKNTGHDYKGRSAAPFSLGLWVHNLKQMKYSPAFVPTGCSASTVKAQTAVTLGAGVQWDDAYKFAQTHDVTLVGGADRTVGAVGGWLQGGGHGALSNTMGMGVDRVLEFVAVTPDGVLRTINACQNQDLFFALRGGGGGTFAVVLQATSLASPRISIQAAFVQFPIPDPAVSTERTRELWGIIVDNSLKWAQEGWGAYVNANSALYINPLLSKESANASMTPLLNFGRRVENEDREIGQRTGFPTHSVLQGEYDAWSHFYDTFAASNSADLGVPLAITSRLIPVTSFETAASRADLLDALVAVQTMAPGMRILVTTPFNYVGDTGATAVHPAWRTSVLHVTTITTWNWNTTLAGVEDKYKLATRAMDNLRRITPDRAAAYVNEADVNELNHEDVFWGEHYPKLLDIKNKYDPERLLDCWHCVGWNPKSPRFSCYVD